MSATLPPQLACPRCGSIIPDRVPTEIRDGTAVRECQRCGWAADLEEVVGCRS